VSVIKEVLIAEAAIPSNVEPKKNAIRGWRFFFSGVSRYCFAKKALISLASKVPSLSVSN
jgi:hypothetical protein